MILLGSNLKYKEEFLLDLLCNKNLRRTNTVNGIIMPIATKFGYMYLDPVMRHRIVEVKMKIGVFKLNWIEQRNLEFDMHEVHSNSRRKEQQKELSTSPSAIDSGYVDTLDGECVFDSCRQVLNGYRQRLRRYAKLY